MHVTMVWMNESLRVVSFFFVGWYVRYTSLCIAKCLLHQGLRHNRQTSSRSAFLRVAYLSLYLESAVLWTVWMRAHCTMCSHARDSTDCLGTKQKTQKKKIWRTEEGSLFLPAVDDASVLFYLFYVQASILYQETITIYPYIIFIHRTRAREREIIVMAGGHIDSSHCIRCLIIIFVLLLFFSLQSQIIVFFLLLFVVVVVIVLLFSFRGQMRWTYRGLFMCVRDDAHRIPVPTQSRMITHHTRIWLRKMSNFK